MFYHPASQRSGLPSSIGLVNMGQEIELKLSIDPGDVDAIIHHPFIARHLAGPVVTKHLVNHYFDTPEQGLRGHAMALRIRWDGNGYVQTLKQKGVNRNGLSVRGEWEWRVEGPDIRPELIPSDLWPSSLKTQLDRLIPVFRTDFQRVLWILRFPVGLPFDIQAPATVEMALDQGQVVIDTRRGALQEEILEIELELLEGNQKILFHISERLGDSVRLTPLDISKAERGYRLLTPEPSTFSPFP